MLRIGWFSTGRGPGSQGFLNLIQDEIVRGVLDAAIEFVFSNREPGEAEGSDRFHDLVRGYGLPLVTLSSRRFRRERGGGPMARHRIEFHEDVLRLLSGYAPDICVLAGYMLIISPEMCRRYPTINLHPALPTGPAGTWQEVIWKLIEDRAAESGVMTHVATEAVDEGPVLAYCSFPIRGAAFDPLWHGVGGRSMAELMTEGEDQPLFEAIRREGLRRERPLLLETLKELAAGRLRVSDGRVLDSDGIPVDAGACLNDRVEEFLTSGGALA